MDEHLNISSVLAFSEQKDTLIAAQQQVTQSVMDNNHMLRDALKQENERADYYQHLYEAEKAMNRQLEERVKQLEERPIKVAGDFIETQNIGRYFAVKPAKRSKQKHQSNDPILPLWDNPAISM